MSTPTPNALAVPDAAKAPAPGEFAGAQLDLIRTTLAVDCTAQEFDLFIEVCKAASLNPFLRQIYALKPEGPRGKLAIHVGIDGQRAIAQRSGAFGGKGRPQFGRPGPSKWDTNLIVPEDCEIVVRRLVPGGGSIATVGYCRFDEFARTVKDDRGGRRLNSMWRTMPYNQLAKCAEAQALRAAFQSEMDVVLRAIQRLGVELDLRGDLGGDEAGPASLHEGEPAMALEAGQTGTRVGTAAQQPETMAPPVVATGATVAAMQAAATSAKANPLTTRNPIGGLFDLWKQVYGDSRPKDKAEQAQVRGERIEKMGRLVGRPDLTSWTDLTPAEIAEATAKLKVLLAERREAAAGDPLASDAQINQAERNPGEDL